MVDELKAKDHKNALASKWKACSTFPVLERKGDDDKDLSSLAVSP